MFWIQGQLGIGDFLSNQDLPNPLPDFQGRLALDFTLTNDPGQEFFVFFDGLIVEQVPEPGTLALLGIGLFGMGLARRRKKV